MENLDPLITDLALILIAAGLVTIVFKRLKQPLVLGYIVAGFLSGPHMPYTPSVEDLSSIHTWSEIGVVFLMFTLGLEFSFRKILRMGLGPVVAACCIIGCMIGIGSGIGHLFGWSGMNSLFLGGMLAMSSTTIIYKAFDDLGVRPQKFAGEVLSVLILEDILGILLMVVLSAMAVSRNFQGWELAGSLFNLGFFLILWFIVGMYLVPLFLRRNIRWINRETLLVISLGLCFLMVVVACRAGYSSAFGAFMMGSILAETVEAENIGKVVGPVKDLFGAIFFVSVGMLVDPQVLVLHAVPIAVITCGILLGQAVLGSLSYLISGQPLKVAMQCGFSMAQIGEFAFIIASLGVTLHVTDAFLYPVVVAVSILTTFLTPYMIRAAQPAYRWVEQMLPGKMLRVLVREKQPSAGTAPASPWKRLAMALLCQTAAYLTLSVAVVALALSAGRPLCCRFFGPWGGNALCAALSLTLASPFLRAIVMRKNRSAEWQAIRRQGTLSRVALWGTVALRFTVVCGVTAYVVGSMLPLQELWPVARPWNLLADMLIAVAACLLMLGSRKVKYVSLRLERTFRHNLKLREERAAEGSDAPAYARRLRSHDMHIARVEVPCNSLWGGKLLRDLDIGRTDHVLIAAIIRGDIRINTPTGDTALFPGDSIDVIGDDEGVSAFARKLEAEVYPATPNDTAHRLSLYRLRIRPESPFAGKTLCESGLREHHHCTAVGFENELDGTIVMAASSDTIHPGDTMWIVGEEQDVEQLKNA